MKGRCNGNHQTVFTLKKPTVGRTCMDMSDQVGSDILPASRTIWRHCFHPAKTRVTDAILRQLMCKHMTHCLVLCVNNDNKQLISQTSTGCRLHKQEVPFVFRVGLLATIEWVNVVWSYIKRTRVRIFVQLFVWVIKLFVRAKKGWLIPFKFYTNIKKKKLNWEVNF